MTEREKVIKGLECCISGNPAICKRVGCPYAEEHDGIGDTCIDHLMADALALLKGQEPRVMTLEEAQGADYCWYESKTANICVLCDATMYPNLNGKPKTELQAMGTAVRGWQYDDAYGKDWRCWTSRPTDEQREAIPWN